jgi:hypothetical protein
MFLNLARITVLFLLMAILSAPADAVVEDPYDLLPKDNVVSGWSKDGDGFFYYPRNIGSALGAHAGDVVNDYGIISLLSQYYMFEMNQIEIRIFEMETGQDAFGLYSVFSDIEAEAEEGEIIYTDPELEPGRTVNPEMRWNGDSELDLLGDHYYIRMIAESDSYKMDLLKFAAKIQKKFDIVGGTLDNDKPLNRDDKVYGSDRLIGGYNALGLYFPVGPFDLLLLGEDDVRCMMAEYRLSPGKVFRQVVVEYPDEQIAKEGYKAFTDWVDDFYYVKRLNIVDSLKTVYGVDEKENYFAGFNDGIYMRLFFGFENADDAKTIVAGYKEKGR